MKLISSKTNKDGKKIVCEDAVFDPSLATLVTVDKTEGVIVLGYDALECGHPLNLPFEPEGASLGVKLTLTGIHTYFLVSGGEYDERLAAYYNEVGDLEFDARLTPEEKALLTHRISWLLMGAYK